MANLQIDLLSLNREILLNPGAASGNHNVALLELETLGLEFLCPLARAIYLIESKRLEEVDAVAALTSTWLIDDSDARGEGEVCFIESATHSIYLRAETARIELTFESEAKLFFNGDFWEGGLRAHTFLELGAGVCLAEDFIKEAFQILDADARRTKSRTRVDPKDHEFVGECLYKLAFVNGIPVDGPTFYDSYHEQSWEDLACNYPQRWDEGDDGTIENSYFCWAHYLSRSQAEQIGIDVSDECAPTEGALYPEWLPKCLAENKDALWVHSDRIQAGYGNALLDVKPCAEAWLAIGCGLDWDAGKYLSGGLEINKTDGFSFPPNAGPLLKVDISVNADSSSSELNILLPYVQRLFSLI